MRYEEADMNLYNGVPTYVFTGRKKHADLVIYRILLL